MSSSTPYKPSPLSFGSQHRTSPFRRANSPASPSPLRPSALAPTSPTKQPTPSNSPSKMSMFELGNSNSNNNNNDDNCSPSLGTPPMTMSPSKQPSPASPFSSPTRTLPSTPQQSPGKPMSAHSLELPAAFEMRKSSDNLFPRAPTPTGSLRVPSPTPPSPTPSRPGSRNSMSSGIDNDRRESMLGHARKLSQERLSNSPFIAHDRRSSAHSIFAAAGEATQDRLASSPFISQNKDLRGSSSNIAAPTPAPLPVSSLLSSALQPQNSPRSLKTDASAMRVGASVMGGGLNAAQARGMREAFQLLDRDGDGQVTRDDVIEMLTNLGQTSTPADLASFFPPGSSTINLPSFLNTLTTLLSPLSDLVELENAFAAFDDDDSGQIEAGELRDALLRTGASLEPSESAISEREVSQVLSSFSGRRTFTKAGSGANLGPKQFGARAEVFKYNDFMNSVRGGISGAQEEEVHV